ncbi:hypothetical protein J5N97_025230 [Dioscorea zingiberensis]|uniref:Uncharacterized protein n=1 Tax=Dioscorea zingiberensis TaxID=325984 RepID=A0A9D5H9T7_9LILI|nr:hypothetical protein J5N97_025230 [Dioscorea zingiberensis]
MERGCQTLIETGSKIQRELRYINKIEREALGICLKEFISELPGRQVSEYQSQYAVVGLLLEPGKVIVIPRKKAML